jgi:hypothetical protein
VAGSEPPQDEVAETQAEAEYGTESLAPATPEEAAATAQGLDE